MREAHVARTQDRYLFPAGKLLEMITIDATTMMGMAHEIGSLEVGKRADVVLIDTAKPHLTPWWMPVHRLMQQATGQDVDTVPVSREVLLAGGVPTRVDIGDVLVRAEETARRHVDRAGLD
ncbi:amidohydrolase family protein [Streptomyces boluensis]|uniref:Amidohydrolase family protein n=1 Tax=Streptomyces boluensis TaxID=1775135 RepID=A0A964UQ94_9ACTN|nr:amidohydrolase family protein [Streptomyces boluensis]NBE53433.1 amidohydrolase family protein [Streptomyces boluensis]